MPRPHFDFARYTAAGLTAVALFVLLPTWGLAYLAFDGGMLGYPTAFRWLPKEFTFNVFADVWQKPSQSLPYVLLLHNSLLVSGGAALLSVHPAHGVATAPDLAGRVAFWHITLPLAFPAIAVAAFVAFLIGYSEFAMGWLFVSSSENVTLVMAVSGMLSSGALAWSRLAALSILMSMPVVSLFLVLRR